MAICLYRGTSLLSRTIRWFTRGPYSHASYQDPWTGFEYESWQDGVRRRNHLGEAHKDGTQIDLFDVDLTAAQHIALVKFLESMVGRPYDFRGVLQFLSKRSQGKNFDRALFCSEYIFAGFQAAGRPLLSRCAPEVVSPTLLSYSPLLFPGKTILSTREKES